MHISYPVVLVLYISITDAIISLQAVQQAFYALKCMLILRENMCYIAYSRTNKSCNCSSKEGISNISQLS